MLKPFLAILFVFFVQGVFGQQPGYIMLIDAENHQPFQVMVGDSSMESSSLGHASIAHLKDSSYRIYIRFIDHSIPEQAFQINIKKDQGYQLRRQNTGRWVLFNWQSQETKPALPGTDSSRIVELGVRRSDPFARLMAAVVNDSSVMYNTYSQKNLAEDSARIALQKRKPESAGLAVTRKPLAAKPVKLTPAQRAEMAKRDRLVKAMQADSLVARQIVNKQLEIDSLQDLVYQHHLQDSLRADSVRIARERALAQPVKLTARQRNDSIHVAAQLRRAYADSVKAANIASRRSADSLKTAEKRASRRLADSVRTAGVRAKKQADSASAAESSVQRARADSVRTALNHPPVAEKSGPDPLAKTPDSGPLYRKAETPASGNFKSSIKKIHDVSLKISRKQVYLDYRAPGIPDTISIFIYFDEKDSVSARKDGVPKTASGPCAVRAETGDVDNVRADILIANNEADKIAAASRSFKQICFSADQLRLLTSLFVTDRGKYKLVEAAYRHVWDPEHLASLRDLFTDKQYVSKFHTLASGK